MEFLFGFLKTRSKKLLTGILLILCGAILWEILIEYSMDYSDTEIFIYQIIAALFALCGLVMIIYHFITKRSHEMDFTETDSQSKAVNAGAHFMRIRSFLQEITDYFMSEGITENMPIQKYCTQIYKNILDLQKRRLTRCQVRLEWKSIPRKYTNKAFTKSKYFDGKYEITEINAQIESKRRYSVGNHTVLLRSDKELAHITEINAKKIGENEIICPNCGCTTTRENLIDGCDYCGTRFTVEDLGEKISDFTLRDDVDLAYEKFKDRRLDRGYQAFLIFFWIFFALVVFCMMIVMTDDSSASGDPLNPLFFTFSVFGVSASFAYLFALCLMVFYLFVIFPVTEILTNAHYHSKKRAQEISEQQNRDSLLQKKIQETDPLFSLTGFYSNIQNKLNTIFYAETDEQLNAFSETNLGKYHDFCKNIIDFDISEMNLEDYHVENELQIADINTAVRLYELTPSGRKVKKKDRHIKIQVVKSVSAKTKAVCTPTVLRCPNCSASLSLLDGMICSHCGTKPDLKQYDWTIHDFQI